MLKSFAVLILSVVLFASTANPQMKKGPSGTPPAQPISGLSTDSSLSNDQRLERQQVGRLFAKGQEQLRMDTAKLVALTVELKQQVEQSDVRLLSVDVVNKAKEIQKLAKSVQDKMKDGY